MDAAKGIALATLLGIGFWCLLGYAAFVLAAPALAQHLTILGTMSEPFMTSGYYHRDRCDPGWTLVIASNGPMCAKELKEPTK